MTRRDITDLVLLAALWGGSFLFMRISTPEFGPVVLAEVRVAVAALLLLPLLWRQQSARAREAGQSAPQPLAVLRDNWRGLALVGTFNSAIPFTLFAVAILSMTSGFASILNSTAPLFGAVIAFVWLRERLPWIRVLGLLIGFAGVALLVWGRPTFTLSGDGWAIVAALCASVSYGISPNYIKRNMTRVPSLAIATGSQIAAALVLLPAAIILWPAVNPSPGAWLSAVMLGIACTGLAYILYFRLIGNIGPTRAIAVTFLIPGVGMLYGAVFLDETVTVEMLAGAVVILMGTALATGLIGTQAVREVSKPEI